jgi:hypothetical protein
MTHQFNLDDDNILKVMDDPKKVTQIIQKGIKAALIKHKQAGNPICEWRGNEIVWVPPEQINIEKEK